MVEKILNVNGMHCKSCEILLNDTISEISGVEKVISDSKKGTVSVIYKEDAILAQIKSVIEKEGYRVIA